MAVHHARCGGTLLPRVRSSSHRVLYHKAAALTSPVTLKSPPALVAPATAELFRTRIKAIELEAERLQQEAMYQLARPPQLGHEATSPVDAARTNVAAYETMRRTAFPKSATETLLAALSGLVRKSEE